MKIIAIGDFHCEFPLKLKKIIKKEKPDLILSTGDYAGNKEWRPLLKKVFKSRAQGKPLSIENILGRERYNQLLKRDYKQGLFPLYELDKLKIPVLSVFGNGDWYSSKTKENTLEKKKLKDYSEIIKKLKNISNINEGKTNFNKIKIIGFGGYLDPDFYFTEEGMKLIATDNESTKRRKIRYLKDEKKFISLMKCKPDIVLSHYTPYKCLDNVKNYESPFNGKNLGVSFYNKGIKQFSPVLFICGHMHENQGKAIIGGTIVINPGSVADGKMAIINFDETKKKVKEVKFIK